jgi:hypothetical protein
MFAQLSGISLAASGELPVRLVFDELAPEDAPVGSQVIFLGYEGERRSDNGDAEQAA